MQTTFSIHPCLNVIYACGIQPQKGRTTHGLIHARRCHIANSPLQLLQMPRSASPVHDDVWMNSIVSSLNSSSVNIPMCNTKLQKVNVFSVVQRNTSRQVSQKNSLNRELIKNVEHSSLPPPLWSEDLCTRIEMTHFHMWVLATWYLNIKALVGAL